MVTLQQVASIQPLMSDEEPHDDRACRRVQDLSSDRELSIARIHAPWHVKDVFDEKPMQEKKRPRVKQRFHSGQRPADIRNWAKMAPQQIRWRLHTKEGLFLSISLSYLSS